MNILTDLLPESVWIGDVEYPIDTDFRTSIKVAALFEDPSLEEWEKTAQTLELYFGGIPSDVETAVEAALAFFECDREVHGEGSKNAVLSFEYDAPYIFAAFFEQYHIDLTEVAYMHWWKFKALFDSLNAHTKIMEIVSYRATDTKGMSKEEKRQIDKLKKMYRLPSPHDRMSDEDKAYQDALDEALMNGGDLSQFGL